MPAGHQDEGSLRDAARAASRRLVDTPDAALLVLLVLMIAFGTWLRIQQLTVPATLSFDEPFFVGGARNYLAHAPDVNDHPPLGKLLIAASMAVAGDGPVGWRLVPLLFGFLNIALAFGIARTVFGNRRSGALAAAFVAADGFLIAYSRTALLDGMLTGGVLGAVLLMLRARRARGVAAAAAVVGLAASIKVSGGAMIVPLLLICLFSRRLPRWSVLMLVAAPLVFYAQYALGLALAGAGSSSPEAVRAALVHSLQVHMSHVPIGHPAASPWYTWFLPLRPLFLRNDTTPLGMQAMMVTIGNPLLWWSSALAVAGMALWHGARGPRTLHRRSGSGAAPVADTNLTVPVVLLSWAVMILPWAFTPRTSFIYHYLPAYTLGLVLLAGVLDRLRARMPLTALLVVAAIAVVTAFYAPVWGQLPLREEAVTWRLFLRVWQ